MSRGLVVFAYALVFWGALPAALLRVGRALDGRLGWTMDPTRAGYAVVLFGLVICAWAILALRRFADAWPVTALPPARVARGGPYEIMRHPIYVGFNIAILGAGFAVGSRALVVIVAPTFLPLWMLYAFLEERTLVRRFGENYVEYRDRVGFAPRFLLRDGASPVPRRRYGGIFVVEYALWAALYYSINWLTADRAVLGPLLPYEDRIPFVAAAYPVYAFVYLQAWLPLLLARSRLEYVRIQVAFGIASAIGFVVFVLWPMAYPRPPIEATGLFARMLAFEYASDRPVCTLPSLHVAIAWILFGSLATTRPRRTYLLVVALAVSASTLLVKQHFVIDVLAGAMLGLLSVRGAEAMVGEEGSRACRG